jgi:hypothetical protein
VHLVLVNLALSLWLVCQCQLVWTHCQECLNNIFNDA